MVSQSYFSIGQILGIPLRVDVSWFIILLLVIANLGLNIIPELQPTWSLGAVLLISIISAVLAFVSVVIHELAHAVVAKAHAIKVEAITLFILGGMAHLKDEPADPASEFRITIAGPLASFGLAIIALGFSSLGAGDHPLTTILFWVGQVNLMLALFNLIPGFPLDGGRLIRAIVWQIWGDKIKATRWLMYGGTVMGLGLILMGIIMLTGFEYPLIETNAVNAAWFIFMGWFLKDAARRSYKNLLPRPAS